MRNTIKVVLFGCAFFTLATASTHALDTKQFQLKENPFRSSYIGLLAQEKDPIIDGSSKNTDGETSEQQPAPEGPAATEEAEAKPAPRVHTIAAGENLSQVAALYGITWNRIFAKNEVILNPDIVSVGMAITIPETDEILPERALPAAPAPQVQPQALSTGTYAAAQPSYASTAGNTYAAGYCTWYAKNRRPDLPNMLGNAAAWVASAAARGYATGTTPQVGAIGQQGNHVVYVESVNPDGTVSISEMNYGGRLFVVHHRTVPASNFTYIY